MKRIDEYQVIFERYGSMMRTKDLQKEKILYRTVQKLIEQGFVEKVRYGYYQWGNPNECSEVGTVIRLFPDAIFCMDTALRFYGYSDRTPVSYTHLDVYKRQGNGSKIAKEKRAGWRKCCTQTKT